MTSEVIVKLSDKCHNNSVRTYAPHIRRTVVIIHPSPVLRRAEDIHECLHCSNEQTALELIAQTEQDIQQHKIDPSPISDYLEFLVIATVTHHLYGNAQSEHKYTQQLFAITTKEERDERERQIMELIEEYHWHVPMWWGFVPHLVKKLKGRLRRRRVAK